MHQLHSTPLAIYLKFTVALFIKISFQKIRPEWHKLESVPSPLTHIQHFNLSGLMQFFFYHHWKFFLVTGLQQRCQMGRVLPAQSVQFPAIHASCRVQSGPFISCIVPCRHFRICSACLGLRARLNLGCACASNWTLFFFFIGVKMKIKNVVHKYHHRVIAFGYVSKTWHSHR